VVEVMTGQRAGRSGFGLWGEWSEISPKRPDRLWEPPSLLFSGCRGLFSRGELSRCEADDFPSICCWDCERVELYLCCPMYLHSVHRSN